MRLIMKFVKSLLIGAGFSLLASPANAEWLFKVEYKPTSVKIVSGTYSCVGISRYESQCNKISGSGEQILLLNFGNGEIKKLDDKSNFVKFPQEIYDRGVIAQPLGKQDLAKFINEISP